MFSDLTIQEKMGWGLVVSSTVAFFILCFMWTENAREARTDCLKAGGSYGIGGSCILPQN